ncbi:outer membrane beta-barrel family protein [Epilithonimonas hungarica]|uniref:Outer membrane receptor proteins, mostly Fe transport n=1 Tax=Epilithonimonas hungarica TaxID=454006 RepID=A0A1G7Q0P1_9FLAO|nr:outer membrane beta-barrel family protein [Epilithonimonas hungarica]SDF91200.1 Outer membrane receptor proteins, mostly Fe transport [Epilithonimonas hungarica]
MKKSILFFLIFISTFIFAQQNLKINGKIINSDKEKNTFPIVVYLLDNENQLLKTTIAQDSKFEFDQLKSGNYHLQLSSDETIQNEKPFYLEKNLELSIAFEPKSQKIDEVTITAKKKIFKVENGNITLDVANSPLNTLPTSTELLSKLPFVMVDANGEGLSFVGKGTPLLYVDNQRVDFATLSSISVDDIKSVEVIRNPSVKYESEGKAVIKVNLKKSRKDGSQLSVSETATFQKRFSNYLSANFQQKKNKTEWKLNVSYNQINHWESNGFDYSVPSKNISSNYVIKSITKRPQTIFGASLYQELNDDGDYITMSVNSNFRPDKGDNNTNTFYSENGNSAFIKTLNQQDSKRATINSIFNYKKKLTDWNAEILTGFQFKRENKNVNYQFFNDTNNSGYEFNQFRVQQYSGNVYSGRVDIEKKLSENYSLKLGGSYTKAETKNDNKTTYQNNQNPEFYLYQFKEANLAGYTNLAFNADKWNINGGLRTESTNAEGFDRIENQTKIKRYYLDWFPNAEISFKQNDNYDYTLNFRKSISRPNYGDLSSGGLYGSPYVEYQGNPDLVPTYTNTISFSANLKKISVNASAYKSKNPLGYTLIYDDEKNISKFTAVNFDKEMGVSLGIDSLFQGKKWTSQNSLSVNYDKIEDSLAVLKKSTPYVYFSTNNTVNVWKYLSILLDGSYITKRVEGLYENNAMCLVNLGMTSSISDFDFTVRYNDVFNQMNYIQKMSYNKMNSTGTFFGNTPTISFAAKYNFGKLKKSNYKENAVNETSNRL